MVRTITRERSNVLSFSVRTGWNSKEKKKKTKEEMNPSLDDLEKFVEFLILLFEKKGIFESLGR